MHTDTTTRRYRFSPRSQKYTWAIRAIDAVGGLFFRHNAEDIEAKNIQTVCFVQLAHMGDLILTLPMLYAFKKLTNRLVRIAVNRENQQLVERFPWIDKVYLIDHPSFARGHHHYRSLSSQFKLIQADLIFEFRGDIRILPLLKLFSRCRHLVGFDAGGGGFFLDRVLPYPFEQHITECFEKIYDVFRIPVPRTLDEWDTNMLPHEEYPIGVEPYVCVNVGVGATARRWEPDKWGALLGRLAQGCRVILIGRIDAEQERDYAKRLQGFSTVTNAINQTSVLQSIFIVKHARAYLGLETGFTHIASVCGKRTVALYSHATDVGIWKPLELYPKQLSIIQKKVPCGPCGKLVCVENRCMQQIQVEEVYQKIMGLIQPDTPP